MFAISADSRPVRMSGLSLSARGLFERVFARGLAFRVYRRLARFESLMPRGMGVTPSEREAGLGRPRSR